MISDEQLAVMSLAELAVLQRDAKENLDTAKQVQSDAQKWFDKLRLQVLPEKMDEMDISSVKINDVGRVTIASDMYASIIQGQQEPAYSWLRANGYGDLVKDFVHSSTLKAFLKEQVKEGIEFPEELFKVIPFERVSITKG